MSAHPPRMMDGSAPHPPRDLIEEAHALGLDVAGLSGPALHDAVRAERARRWIEQNREAIEAWNRWTEENEFPLAKYRTF
jgi:post-segregation antitoxin (ccd killing protein)